MTVYDVIDRKKRGFALTEGEIRFFVQAVTDGRASDAQIAAFCMAVLWRGMTEEECFFLTDAMARSGDIIPRPAAGGPFADKHSTGGVSDSTSLILVPVLAACGVRCAKYSGRALGHTGGTLDKLESFPGLRVSLTAEEFARQVEEVGCAIAGQTARIVPADKRMYAVRDVTATVDSIPLIASSVMSKKLASFADVILLDVKYGEGAFVRAPEDAVRLGMGCMQGKVSPLQAFLRTRCSTSSARRAGAGCLKISMTESPQSHAARSAFRRRMADRESPPASKKLLCPEAGAEPRTCFHASQTMISVLFLGV